MKAYMFTVIYTLPKKGLCVGVCENLLNEINAVTEHQLEAAQ